MDKHIQSHTKNMTNLISVSSLEEKSLVFVVVSKDLSKVQDRMTTLVGREENDQSDK